VAHTYDIEGVPMRGQVLSWCVAVGILAGCGSSKAVSTGSPASTTATTAGAPTVTTAGTATTTKSAAAPTTSAGAAPQLTGAADNDFCRYLVNLGKKTTFDDLDVPQGLTPEQLKQATNEAQTLYNDMARRAPADIKTEMLALSANFNRLAAIYASVGYDIVKLQQQMSDPTSGVAVEFSKLGAIDSAAAGERVGAYIENVCGLK
jgi:hypothetical protein